MSLLESEWARRKSLFAALGLVATLLFVPTRARAEVSVPLPGVVLVREGAAAMTISNLCAPGISVRATKYAEREATPEQWAQSVGAQVAINADFFDFPGWSYILVRARGDGEEWPAGAELLEQPSSYWYFGRNIAGLEPSSLTPSAPWETNIVGAYDTLIENGQVHAFTPDETFMLSAYRRSAIGLSADRSVLYFYASDAPINGPDMANQMIAMAGEAWAPPIDVATNQDGGGSSQLYVQGLGQVIDSGRQVNTHLGVYASGAGPALNCPLTRSKHASGGVASWSPSRLDLFLRSDGGGLQHKSFGSGWSGWEPLGPSLVNQPVVSSWSGDRLDTLGRTTDGSLTHTYWNGTAFGTDVVATGVDSDPVMTSWGENRLDAFAVAKDHSLDHFYWNGSAWGRDSLGGDLASAPAVTSWSSDRLDLFAIGADSGMKHQYWDGTQWGSAWESLPGNPASAISVTSFAPYRLDAFALAADHTVDHWYWGGGWGKDSLGGNLASAPTVASWGPGRLDVFAVAPDHTLQHATPAGYAWSAWENLGGSIVSTRAPQVVSWAPNRLDIFAEGTDRAMWHYWWDGVAWGTWESLGGTFPNDDPPSGGTGPNGSDAADAGSSSSSAAIAGADAASDSDSSGCSAAPKKSPVSKNAWLVLAFVFGVVVVRRRRSRLAPCVLFAAALASGCSDGSSSENVGKSSAAIATVCGADRFAGPQGVDVSKYNGLYDWNAAHASGVVWGYVSVGDGFDPDPYFDADWQNMKAAGILRGAYQFFEPGEDEVAQANEVVAATGRLGEGDLPAAIDVEVTGGQSGDVIAAKVRHWIDIVRDGTGKTPIIYTGPYFWEEHVGAGFGDIALWVADYGPPCPLLPDGWGNWLFWQYDDSGGSLDVDVFNGSEDNLRALASGGASRSNHANGGVASWSQGRLDLFLRESGGGLQHKSFGSGWSDWEPLGPAIMNQPVAASWGADRLDVLGRAPDGSLSHTYWNGSAFGTDVIATGVDSDPVMTSWGENRLDAFAVAKDHSLDHFFWNGVAWGRDSLGGDLASAPVVTSWSNDRLDLLAIGSDGGMKHQYWDGTQWGSAWESLSGNPASAISLVAWAPGRLDAFALAADHTVDHWYWGGAWGKDSLGGNLASAPTVASWGPGRLDVFAIAPDHTLQHATPAGYAWSAWENLGGSLATTRAPQVVSWAPNRLDIFAEGTDRAMWHYWWDGTAWGTWESLGGTFPNDDPPSGGTGPNGSNGADAGSASGSTAGASDDGGNADDGNAGGCNASARMARSENALAIAAFLLGLALARRRK